MRTHVLTYTPQQSGRSFEPLGWWWGCSCTVWSGERVRRRANFGNLSSRHFSSSILTWQLGATRIRNSSKQMCHRVPLSERQVLHASRHVGRRRRHGSEGPPSQGHQSSTADSTDSRSPNQTGKTRARGFGCRAHRERERDTSAGKPTRSTVVFTVLRSRFLGGSSIVRSKRCVIYPPSPGPPFSPNGLISLYLSLYLGWGPGCQWFLTV